MESNTIVSLEVSPRRVQDASAKLFQRIGMLSVFRIADFGIEKLPQTILELLGR